MAALRKRGEKIAAYKRILRNASWLFSTQILGGLVGVVTLAMMARTLGPAGLGVIAIVQAYTRIVDRLVRLEPWQAVIRYGMEAIEANDEIRFLRLIKASVLIDTVGALIAGVVALGLASVVAPLLSLTPDAVGHLQVLSLGLFVMFQPTGIAILRVLDRFDLLAKIDFCTVLVRFGLTFIAFWFEMELWAFIAILLVERLMNATVGFGFGLREMRRRGCGSIMKPKLGEILRQNPGLLRLLWNSNINVILRQSTQRFDILILSAFANTSDVGAYFLARRLADAMLKLTRPLSQVVYPELVRMWASDTARAFRKLVVNATLILASISAVFYVPAVVFMADLLAFFFGEEFRAAALLVSIQMLAVAVYLTGTMANPALLAIGKDKELVKITFFATVIFFVLIIPLILAMGPIGLSLNHLFFNLLWLVGCVVVVRRTIRERKVADGADTRETGGQVHDSHA